MGFDDRKAGEMELVEKKDALKEKSGVNSNNRCVIELHNEIIIVSLRK